MNRIGTVFCSPGAVNRATRQSLADSMIAVPLGIAIYMLLLAVSMLIEKAFHLQGKRKRVFRASLIYGNIGLMGIPQFFDSALTAIGNTSMPLALIYIGVVLCISDIRPALRCGELYTGIIVKMTILPVICYIVMCLIGISEDMAGTLAFIVALPGIEMVPMLAKNEGSEGDYAVCAIMMMTIACLLTLPIVSLCVSLLG